MWPLTEVVDFPVTVIGVMGIMLLRLEMGRKPARVLSVAIGSMLVGVAAAIRGPLMLGGPLFLAAMALAARRRRAMVTTIAFAAFALPVATEVAVQRHFRIVNNSVVCL